MIRPLAMCAMAVLLVGCDEDPDPTSRVVVELKSPMGHQFHFMPIIEDGVSDIMVRVAWPSDWAYDPALNPATPFVGAEVILGGGTAELKPQDLQALFQDANAWGHLFAGADYVYGELEFPVEQIERIVPVAAEMLAQPTLDPAWIGRIRSGMMDNQINESALLENQMWAVGRAAMLDGSAVEAFLGLPDPTVFADVDRALLLDWHGRTFTKSGATIAIAGAATPEQAGDIVDTLLEQLPEGSAVATIDSGVDYTPKMILLHVPDAPKTTIGLIGQMPPTSEGDDLVDMVAIRAFSQAGSSPLFDAVRTELRASYGLGAGFANYDRAARLIYIGGEVETQKLAQAHEVILQTYSDFVAAPVISDFEDFRDTMASDVARNVQSVSGVTAVIHELVLDGQDATQAPTVGDFVGNLTQRDIVERVRSAFPAASDLIVVAASPDANALPGACVITKIEDAAACP